MSNSQIKYIRSNSDDVAFITLIEEFNITLTADYGVNQTDYDEQNIFPDPIDIIMI